MVGEALHGGDHHGNAGCPPGGENKTCGMEHAVRTEKRTAAEFEGYDVALWLARPTGPMYSLF
ncbi:MAG: hypothetical protein DMG56_10560 [Acidobacteria bacterium]|nr:MAG: hypothetical protein DMG56_10560 [Acidobacteriota bacterium]